MQQGRGPPAATQVIELSPAEAEKERGNAAFKQGDLHTARPSPSVCPACTGHANHYKYLQRQFYYICCIYQN